MITIDGREISENVEPYIVAEISANHNGKIENAFKNLYTHSLIKSGSDIADTEKKDSILDEPWTPERIPLLEVAL